MCNVLFIVIHPHGHIRIIIQALRKCHFNSIYSFHFLATSSDTGWLVSGLQSQPRISRGEGVVYLHNIYLHGRSHSALTSFAGWGWKASYGYIVYNMFCDGRGQEKGFHSGCSCGGVYATVPKGRYVNYPEI